MHLSLRNLSTIPADQLPIIQRLIEQDLKTHGITASGDESANALRITLSENARERLWIAEVIEGKETQLAMVRADRDPAQPTAPAAGLTLRRQLLAILPGPVLDALEIPGGLITLTPEAIVIYARSDDGWREQSRLRIGLRRALPRDPRGMLVATSGAGFEAWLPGAWCAGTHAITPSSTGWTINCHESDDPWPILENSAAIGAPTLKAFYNAGRNYFTGVVTPNLPVDLPAFYSAAIIPRAAGGAAMLINGIDSKVQLLDNGALKTVVGTRDWGSDFAALSSGCGSGTQIIASGSGEALGDSLRAYEIPVAGGRCRKRTPRRERRHHRALGLSRLEKPSSHRANRDKPIRGGPCYGNLQLVCSSPRWLCLLLARTRPHYGGTLHVEIEGEPWQRPDGLARRLVLDGLTALDADGTVRPALSTQWDSDGSDHRWQFRLRPGVHFHDGSSLTSIAVVAALNVACPSNCPWTAIHAVGSSVVFTSDAPMPNLPALLAGDNFLIALTITADGKTPRRQHRNRPFRRLRIQQRRADPHRQRHLLAGSPLCGLHRNSRASLRPRSVARSRHGHTPTSSRFPPRRFARHSSSASLSPSRRPSVLLALQITDYRHVGKSQCCARPLRRPSIAARSQRHLSKTRRDHRGSFAAISHRIRFPLPRRARSEQSP